MRLNGISSNAIHDRCLCICYRKHGLYNFSVTSAAAQYATDTIEYLLLGRLRMTLQHIGSGHQHSRCADTALRCTVIHE